MLSFGFDSAPQSFCYWFIALRMIRCSKSAPKFAVHVVKSQLLLRKQATGSKPIYKLFNTVNWELNKVSLSVNWRSYVILIVAVRFFRHTVNMRVLTILIQVLISAFLLHFVLTLALYSPNIHYIFVKFSSKLNGYSQKSTARNKKLSCRREASRCLFWNVV